MRSKLLVIAMTLGIFSAMSWQAEEAAAQIRVGPNIGWNFDVEEGLIGADLWVGLMNISDMVQLHINGAWHWYFIGDVVNLWDLEVNFPFLFKVNDVVWPYAAPGFGIFHSKVDVIDVRDTEFTFNIIGGAMFLPESVVNPFAQFRGYFGGTSGAEIVGGAMFQF